MLFILHRDYCKSQKMINLFKSLQDTAENKSKVLCEPKDHDLDKSLINQTLNENKIVLYGSNLKPKNRKRLTYLGTEKKLKIANSLR